MSESESESESTLPSSTPGYTAPPKALSTNLAVALPH